MIPEQKAVILDYATELQGNDAPWREFEVLDEGKWVTCVALMNPLTHWQHFLFRRKPRTITVTMPTVWSAEPVLMNNCALVLGLFCEADRDKALAAIRGVMKDE